MRTCARRSSEVGFAKTPNGERDVTLLRQIWTYAAANPQAVATSARAHVELSFAALAIAAAICIPLGVWTSRHAAGTPVVGVVTALRSVPSLAVLALVMPVLGLGFRPALVALVLLACPPILINTDLAYRGIDAAVKEAAVGMGMRGGQVLRRVETPLALPVIITGVRTAAVEVIASATLAAFIGGGGFGDLIIQGLQVDDTAELLLGALCVGLLALVTEGGLSALARAASAPQQREPSWAT